MTSAAVLGGEPWCVECGDALEVLRNVPDCSAQMCCTSPPYYALRDYGVSGQIGLEKTPEEYVARLVEVFREVKRVLRDDGTLWLNIGDSYANNSCLGRKDGGRPATMVPRGRGGALVPSGSSAPVPSGQISRLPPGTKPKDLLGIPWLLAFALRADGWYLRSEIVWCKRSPMPESVRDRPTRAHEQVFLFSKAPKYFYDQEAERVTPLPQSVDRSAYPTRRQSPAEALCAKALTGDMAYGQTIPTNPAGRNLWSYWPDIAPSPDSAGHFALMPLALAARCVRLGTSAEGCCAHCGAPRARVVERSRRGAPVVCPKDSSFYEARGGQDATCGLHSQYLDVRRDHLGWRPSCACPDAPAVGSVVLDPFAGAGTTGVAARNLGRRFLGVELNPQYAELARRRIGAASPLLDHHDREQARATQRDLFGDADA